MNSRTTILGFISKFATRQNSGVRLAFSALLLMSWFNTANWNYLVKPKLWDLVPQNSVPAGGQERSPGYDITHRRVPGTSSLSSILGAKLRSGMLVAPPSLPSFVCLFLFLIFALRTFVPFPAALLKRSFESDIFHPLRVHPS